MFQIVQIATFFPWKSHISCSQTFDGVPGEPHMKGPFTSEVGIFFGQPASRAPLLGPNMNNLNQKVDHPLGVFIRLDVFFSVFSRLTIN